MEERELKVLRNEEIGFRTYLMVLEGEGLPEPKPGQFLMLSVSNTLEPLLRRAFAVAHFERDKVFLIYYLLGRGTHILSERKRGEVLRALLFLGKGTFKVFKKNLLVGGGVGLSALTYLAQEVLRQKKELFILYGGRTKRHLGLLPFLRELGLECEVFTEDGSFGKKGNLLKPTLEFDRSWVVQACGPRAMLKAFKEKLRDRKLYLSLEAPMACGYGVCLGCVVRGEDGKYYRVCVEGPVFEASKVVIK